MSGMLLNNAISLKENVFSPLKFDSHTYLLRIRENKINESFDLQYYDVLQMYIIHTPARKKNKIITQQYVILL